MATQSNSEAVTDRRLFLRNLGLIAAAANMLWLAPCTKAQPLVVALHPGVGHETLYLAQELKWLPDRVQLRDDKTLGESLAALQSGQAVAACMTLDEMLRGRAAGIPLSAALVIDISAGAHMVLARPGIRNLAGLLHKRIGFDRDALGALVLGELLERAGMPASAIIPVDLPPVRQLDAWRRKEVDAVITYEPMATPFMLEGARNVFDSRQMPDTIIDLLAVRRDRTVVFALVRALTASHFRALDHMHTNEQDALYRISARAGVSPGEVQRMLAGVTFPSLASNRNFLMGGNARLVQAARTLSTLMVQRGLLAREDDLDKLIMPGALPPDER